MNLLDYWPTEEEIARCIKAEAESVSDEVLLAVHQSFPVAYHNVGADGKVNTGITNRGSESELLEHLLSSAPEGSTVVPISGASGVGKSHLIRILDARIRNLPNADNYLVIRIPKSASLKRVVELILDAEPLEDKKYDEVKEAYKKALADIPLEEAVINFQAQMEIALQSYSQKLDAVQTESSSDSSIGKRSSHAKKLPSLMSDDITVDYFRKKVFPRIVKRAVQGISTEGSADIEIDPKDGQFKAEDLDLYDRTDIDINKSSRNVSMYYQFLQSQGGQNLADAAEVLNDVVDEATQRLYKLHDSVGGLTLGEVILEIRKLLRVDKKDLVILVEDFYALVGIQETLAKVLIQQGVTSDGEEIATIRSAIAVTDGFLDGKDTLATRAGRQWFVESRLENEGEALTRTCSLVAAYLNAARLGEAEIKKYYKRMAEQSKEDIDSWPPPIFPIDENVETDLEAFGSVNGISLFPFTSWAIEYLSREGSTVDRELVFNPRYVIKKILRHVLISGRTAFRQGDFPQPELLAKSPTSDVSQWINSLSITEEMRDRYKRFITIWGNNPPTRAEIGRIPGGIFEVFGLSEANFEEIKPILPATPVVDSDVSSKSSTSGSPDLDKKQAIVSEYQNLLEGWVQNDETLGQTFSNKIRGALAGLMNQRLDWNAERCEGRDIGRNFFSLPRARGEQGLVTTPIRIAPDNKDPDGSLRRQLLALLRVFDVFKGDDTYPEYCDDLVSVGSLFDQLAPTVLALERTKLDGETKWITDALIVNSNMLGISSKGDTPKSIAKVLLMSSPQIEESSVEFPSEFEEWNHLQRNALDSRAELQQLLFRKTGCFQGSTGKSVNCIDINYVVDVKKSNIANDKTSFDKDHRDLVRQVSDLKRYSSPRVKKVLGRAEKTLKMCEEELGENFDKNQILERMSALAEMLKDTGVWSAVNLGFTAKEYTDVCESFRTTPIKDNLGNLHNLINDKSDQSDQSDQKKIARVGKLLFTPFVITEKFLEQSQQVLKFSMQRVETLEEQYGDVSVKEISDQILKFFDRIESSVQTLSQEIK